MVKIVIRARMNDLSKMLWDEKVASLLGRRPFHGKFLSKKAIWI